MVKSVYTLLLRHVQDRPNAPAMLRKRAGSWQAVTWSELHTWARRLSAALVSLGVEKGDRVLLMASTRPEWLALDLGILGAGAVTVPAYVGTVPEDLRHIAKDSGAVVAVVENLDQLMELRALRPGLRHAVVLDQAPPVDAAGWVDTWDAFQRRGDAFLQDRSKQLDARTASVERKDLATIIYTSGTTGRPKGVMLDHDNLLYEADALGRIGVVSVEDVHLLVLPMAHVFAKVIEVTWLRLGFQMAVAEAVERLITNMAEVRPTVMCAVPRIYERIHARVVAAGLSQSGVKGRLFRLAIEEAERAGRAQERGDTHGGLRWNLANALVLRQVSTRLRELFGGRLRVFISGGAPLPRRIASFFHVLGLDICEGYGLTETCGATCLNLPTNLRIGSVGPPLPGTEVRAAPDGELLVRGRGVMRGYWHAPEATAEMLDGEGWLHTGDIGVINEDGFVHITDRKKEIIVTAGGKNVAPQNLESALQACPFISHALVHGDGRRYLTALLTLREDAVRRWANDQHLDLENRPLASHPAVFRLVQDAVDQVNRGLARYEQVRKFAILDQDFTVGDELTPTQKIKRKHCAQKYKAVLEGFYGSDPSD